MQTPLKTGPESNKSIMFSAPLPRPRLWVVLSILALPFLIVSAKYLEALERTGTGGAFIADMAMSALISGYPVLLWVLKKNKI